MNFYMRMILTVLVFTMSMTFAQDKSGNQSDYLVSNNLEPPDLTAFKLLGVNPDAIETPQTIKDMAISVLNNQNLTDKTIGANMAIELSPLQLIASNRTTSFYRDNATFIRSSVTFGTAKDSSGTNVALGFKYMPIDDSDPITNIPLADLDYIITIATTPYDKIRNDIGVFMNTTVVPYVFKITGNALFDGVDQNKIDALEKALLEYLEPDTNKVEISKTVRDDLIDLIVTTLSIQDDSRKNAVKKLINDDVENLTALAIKRDALAKALYLALPQLKEGLNKSINEFIDSFNKSNWNAQKLYLAGGFIWNSESSTWDKLKHDYFQLYAGYARPLTKNGQIVAQAEYKKYNKQVNEDIEFAGGFKGLAGNKDNKFSLELMLKQITYSDTTENDELFHFGAGLEYKLTEGIWFVGSVGADLDDFKFKDAPIITSASIKYAPVKKVKR